MAENGHTMACMTETSRSVIRWGILGAANIAKTRVIPAMMQLAPSVEVRGIASRTRERAEAFAEEFKIPLVFASYQELIDSKEIDAVYIPLPISEHRRWAERCALAGKPALVEKSLAENAPAAGAIRDAFVREGVMVAEALMYRYHPLIRRVKALIDSGRIGTMQLIRSNFEISLPRTDIRYFKALGGGAMLDLGCYNVSIARYLTGEEPIRMHGVGQFGEVDEVFAGLMQFPSGVVSHLGCSLRGGFDCSFEVVGAKGRIRVDRGGMVVWPGEDFRIKIFEGDVASEELIPAADSYVLMVDDFCRKMREGVVDSGSLDDAIANLRVIDAMLASAQ